LDFLVLSIGFIGFPMNPPFFVVLGAQEAGALFVELLQAMCHKSSSTGAPGGQWGPQVVLTNFFAGPTYAYTYIIYIYITFTFTFEFTLHYIDIDIYITLALTFTLH